MIYEIKLSSQFRKDFKKCVKRGLNVDELKRVISLLQHGFSTLSELEVMQNCSDDLWQVRLAWLTKTLVI